MLCHQKAPTAHTSSCSFVHTLDSWLALFATRGVATTTQRPPLPSSSARLRVAFHCPDEDHGDEPAAIHCDDTVFPTAHASLAE